jgi:hypothetical protein
LVAIFRERWVPLISGVWKWGDFWNLHNPREAQNTTLRKLCLPSLHLGTPFRTAVCCILCTTWGDLCVIKCILVDLYGGVDRVDRVDLGFGHSLFRSTTDLFS